MDYICILKTWERVDICYQHISEIILRLKVRKIVCGYVVHYQSANMALANWAFHPSEVGQWIAIHVQVLGRQMAERMRGVA